MSPSLKICWEGTSTNFCGAAEKKVMSWRVEVFEGLRGDGWVVTAASSLHHVS